MKAFVAILLFAFIAGLRADDFGEFSLMNGAEGELPDRRPYVVCITEPYLRFKILGLQR